MTMVERMEKLKVGSKWEHYKGGVYTVKGVARMEETQALVVVYESKSGDLWVRPIDNFLGDKDDTRELRFTPLTED